MRMATARRRPRCSASTGASSTPRSRSTALRATPQRAAKAKPVVVRLHEASGSARTGWDAAVKAALKAARAEVDDPIAVEIARQWADGGPEGPPTYHVNVKGAYRRPRVHHEKK